MMDPNVQEICKQAKQLIKERKYEKAEKLLSNGLQKYPDEPDLNAYYALRLIYSQREPEAIKHLQKAKGAKLYPKAAQMLVDFFYCRSLMAKKLSIHDEIGKNCHEQISQITGLKPGNVGITLSACLITKNEEKTLERCLKSIDDLVDEIVVVDTGSVDQTVEIAKKYGAKLGFFEWNNDCSAARNESLKLATGHWILFIDSDEELTKESFSRIQEGLMRPQFGGYHIKIINYMSDQDGANQYVHTPLRILQRLEGVFFEGRIHEQVIHRLEALGYITANIQNVILYHYGYAPSVMQEKNKAQCTISLLEKALEENPNDAFQWFNLANAYIVAERIQECEEAARKSIERAEAKSNYGPIAYNLLASSLTEQKRPLEALRYCDEADHKGYGGVLNEFERAHALLVLDQLEEALQTINYCMTLSWPDDYDGDFSITTYKANVLKGQILAKMQRYDEALKEFNQALKVAPNFGVSLYSKGTTLACMGQEEEALAVLTQCFDDPKHAQKALNLAIHLYIQHENYPAAAKAIEKLWWHGNYDEELFSKWTLCSANSKDPETLKGLEAVFEKMQNLSSRMLVNYGRALQAHGRNETALECFQQAISKASDDPNAFFNAGDVLYLMDRFQEAAEHYEAGLRLSPQNSNAWVTLGNSLFRLGILHGAKISYEQALLLEPNHPLAKSNLALLIQEEKHSA